jgi:hypothetical protein
MKQAHFQYSDAEKLELLQILRANFKYLSDWLDIQHLEVLANRYLIRRHHRSISIDEGARRDQVLTVVKKIETVSALVPRNTKIKAMYDASMMVPGRHLMDSAILKFAEQMVAGKVKQIDFEREIFHRVIDNIRPRIPDKTTKGNPGKKDRKNYFAGLQIFWWEMTEATNLTCSKQFVEFAWLATNRVLVLSKENLKEGGFENEFKRLRPKVANYFSKYHNK